MTGAISRGLTCGYDYNDSKTVIIAYLCWEKAFWILSIIWQMVRPPHPPTPPKLPSLHTSLLTLGSSADCKMRTSWESKCNQMCLDKMPCILLNASLDCRRWWKQSNCKQLQCTVQWTGENGWNHLDSVRSDTNYTKNHELNCLYCAVFQVCVLWILQNFPIFYYNSPNRWMQHFVSYAGYQIKTPVI